MSNLLCEKSSFGKKKKNADLKNVKMYLQEKHCTYDK